VSWYWWLAVWLVLSVVAGVLIGRWLGRSEPSEYEMTWAELSAAWDECKAALGAELTPIIEALISNTDRILSKVKR